MGLESEPVIPEPGLPEADRAGVTLSAWLVLLATGGIWGITFSLAKLVTEAGAHPTFTTDVLSTVSASHFTVRGSNKVGEATQGTRPGHPYADAVFAIAFQRVLKNVAKIFDDQDLRPNIPFGQQHTFHQQQAEDSDKLPIPAFFDDFTVTVFADSPGQLFDKVREALRSVAAGLTTHGMQVNDSAGKQRSS